MQDAAPPVLSPFREELYRLELEYCKTYKRNTASSDRLRRKISSLLVDNCENWDEWSRRGVQSVFQLYDSLALSTKTLRKLIQADPSKLTDITLSSFGDAIDYVSVITDLDLSHIQEVRLEHYDCSYSEAECVACNQDNHYIYYSLKSNQVSSADLLCHEIGHAADFINARRNQEDDQALYRHQSLAEAVAYYCQFRYLQDHGNVEKRTGVLGAFLYTYLAYLVCRYCFDKNVPLDQIEPADAVEGELLEPFVTAYASLYGADAAKEFLAQKIHETQTRFQGLGYLVYQELSPRLGIPLALAFLETEDLDLSRVSTGNILGTELTQVIQSIDPRAMDKLSNLDALIANFIKKEA